jgi:hypothetical protein
MESMWSRYAKSLKQIQKQYEKEVFDVVKPMLSQYGLKKSAKIEWEIEDGGPDGIYGHFYFDNGNGERAFSMWIYGSGKLSLNYYDDESGLEFEEDTKRHNFERIPEFINGCLLEIKNTQQKIADKMRNGV